MIVPATLLEVMILLSLLYHSHRNQQTLCNQATSQARGQWPINAHKFSNYIFHNRSFPKVVPYFHWTLSIQRHGLGVQVGIYSRYVVSQLVRWILNVNTQTLLSMIVLVSSKFYKSVNIIKYIRSLSWEKYSLNLLWRFWKKHISV